jgi:hypothetical protein
MWSGAGSACAQWPGWTPSPATPVDAAVAPLAVEYPLLELALQVALHLQQLQADELRLEDWPALGQSCGLELIDQSGGLGRLLGHAGDRPLQGVALAVHHCGGMVWLVRNPQEDRPTAG